MLDGNNKAEKIDFAIREYWIVRFYNRLTCNKVEDFKSIPIQDLKFIINIPYVGMVTPFIKKNNWGRDATAKRFNIGTSYAKKLLKK